MGGSPSTRPIPALELTRITLGTGLAGVRHAGALPANPVFKVTVKGGGLVSEELPGAWNIQVPASGSQAVSTPSATCGKHWPSKVIASR